MLFQDIGKKIKTLAIFSFMVTVILGFIGGILCMQIDDDGHYVLIGLLIMVLGFVVGWVSSMFLYGFGELIDQSVDANQQLMRTNKLLTAIEARLSLENQPNAPVAASPKSKTPDSTTFQKRQSSAQTTPPKRFEELAVDVRAPKVTSEPEKPKIDPNEINPVKIQNNQIVCPFCGALISSSASPNMVGTDTECRFCGCKVHIQE